MKQPTKSATPLRWQIPERMYASVIRRERFGEPETAFATEVVDTPTPGQGTGAGVGDGRRASTTTTSGPRSDTPST